MVQVPVYDDLRQAFCPFCGCLMTLFRLDEPGAARCACACACAHFRGLLPVQRPDAAGTGDGRQLVALALFAK